MKRSKILIAALSAVMLSSCSSQKPLFLMHIVDVSASARADEAFGEVSKKICHGIVNAAKEKDLYSYIAVDAEISPAADPIEVASRDDMHKSCNQESSEISLKEGTSPCLAWERALQLLTTRVSGDEYTPIVISQIQANEGDKECNEEATSLANKIKEHQGRFIVAGSTNKGNTGYNDWLWETLTEGKGGKGSEKASHVSFPGGDVPKAVEKEIKKARKEGAQ